MLKISLEGFQCVVAVTIPFGSKATTYKRFSIVLH